MENRETDWSRDVLERIVALLLSLAGLADRAAGASFLRRRHVLGILSHGEAEARAFVIAMASGMPVPVDAPDPDPDAAGLAARLRALALLLCAMLAWRAALPGAAGPLAVRRSHGISRPVRRLDARAFSAFDTS